MPELPEAETIVRGLRGAVVDRTVLGAEVLHADVLREPAATFGRRVRGRRIVAVERRGKNVVLRLDHDGVLAVNLGMTGRLLPSLAGKNAPRATHPAVRFALDEGRALVFDDVRRFGTVERLSEAEWAERSGRMGPEPLDAAFTAVDLHDRLSASRAPVRSWLLDQRRIAGVGNIYANEALFLAGIHPRAQARRVTGEGAARLHDGLRRVLTDAIRAGGTTIRDYRNADGGKGEYATRLWVYGRDGEPCRACGADIERIVFGGRSAFRCRRCQPARGLR